MKKLVGFLVSAILLNLAYAGTAMGAGFTINPGAYTGQWSLNYGPARQGVAVVELGPVDSVIGAHLISISGAELFFNVSSRGKVTVANPDTARGGKSKLTFKTTKIAVDPGFFTGEWRVTQGATPNLVGPQTMTLVPGLQFYSMSIGATGGFTFHIAGDGTVTVKNSLAGTGGAGTLKFNNTERFLAGQ